jgi:type IV pilus assembly protein PilV
MTMIEVLVALLVLSIGLAGLAALQISSMQYVHSSHYRSLASAIALDMEERLWLELADNTLSGCPDVSMGTGSTLATAKSDWSRSEVGSAWFGNNADLLTLPNLSVTVGTATTGARTTEIPVTLSWGEQRFSDTEGTTTESFNYTIRMFCRVTTST